MSEGFSLAVKPAEPGKMIVGLRQAQAICCCSQPGSGKPDVDTLTLPMDTHIIQLFICFYIDLMDI